MKAILYDIFGATSLSTFKKEYGYGPIIFSLIIVWPIVGFLPDMPQPVLYFALGAVSLWSLNKAKYFCTPLLILAVYLPLEIVLSNAPSFFSPWLRYVLFAFVLLSLSSLCEGEKLVSFRKKTFRLILTWCILLSVGSFFARLLGINYMENYWAHSITAKGIFGGLTHHSMILGPISAVSTIYLIYKTIETRHKVLVLFALMCFGCVIITASRASFVGCIVGLAALLCLLMRTRSASRTLKYSLLIGFICVASFPYWSETFYDSIIAKNEGSLTEISTRSRDYKWANRMREFELSPIVGVGFSCVDMRSRGDYTDFGTIETGSSWLSVLSMTGLVGATIMLWILFKGCKNLLRNNSPNAILIFSILAFFIIGMMAEGYIFAGGNFLCMLFWLTLGRAYDV